MTIDDDGTVLYSTGLGHGDALHVATSTRPPRPRGVRGARGHGVVAARASVPRSATPRTGEVLWSMPATARHRPRGLGRHRRRAPRRRSRWAVVARRHVELAGRASCGPPTGELLGDHHPARRTSSPGGTATSCGRSPTTTGTRRRSTGVPTISKWNWETISPPTEIYRATGTLSDNGTKGTPALQADLFGDWREEIVTRLADSSALRIATTVDLTDHRLRTLQSDPVYRLGVAWQNTGYNQPPHTRYFLGDGMTTPPAPSIVYTEPLPVRTSACPVRRPRRPRKGVLSSDNWDNDSSYTVADEPVVGPERPDGDAAGERRRDARRGTWSTPPRAPSRRRSRSPASATAPTSTPRC